MTRLKTIEECVVAGLESYLLDRFGNDVAVIMANQTGKTPAYPYISYTITTPIDANAKGWCKADDGSLYRQMTQVWSLTAQSDTIDTADDVMQACFEWFDVLGHAYLSDHNISVERVLNVGNRDNLLTIEYEYRRGFDVRVTYMHIIDSEQARRGILMIESASFTSNFKEDT